MELTISVTCLSTILLTHLRADSSSEKNSDGIELVVGQLPVSTLGTCRSQCSPEEARGPERTGSPAGAQPLVPCSQCASRKGAIHPPVALKNPQAAPRASKCARRLSSSGTPPPTGGWKRSRTSPSLPLRAAAPQSAAAEYCGPLPDTAAPRHATSGAWLHPVPPSWSPNRL